MTKFQMGALACFVLTAFAPLLHAESTDAKKRPAAPSEARAEAAPIERLAALGLPGIDVDQRIVPARRYVIYQAASGVAYITDTISGVTVSTSDPAIISLIDPVAVSGPGTDK